jgi:hypothetical protein
VNILKALLATTALSLWAIGTVNAGELSLGVPFALALALAFVTFSIAFLRGNK